MSHGSADLDAAFNEVFRALKRGCTFAVADITLQEGIPERARMDMDSWSACLAGALTDSDHKNKLLKAGFTGVKIEHISDSNIGGYPIKYFSSHITARKPAARLAHT
jgi:hypothetical protein